MTATSRWHHGLVGTIAPTDIQVLAARLRMEVDEKLGRESDPRIREIAEWHPQDEEPSGS